MLVWTSIALYLAVFLAAFVSLKMIQKKSSFADALNDALMPALVFAFVLLALGSTYPLCTGRLVPVEDIAKTLFA